MWHGLGIAAHPYSGLFFFCGFVGYVDELAAQRLHLLLDAGAHIGRLNHRAQALGGGNGLQSGHAHTQNHHTGRLDGARRSHEHGEKTLVFVGSHDDRLVARNIGLAGEYIHALGAGGAGCGFQRKRGEFGVGKALQAFPVEGVEHADQCGTGLHLRGFVVKNVAHLDHQLTAQSPGGVGNLGSGGKIGLIGDAGCQACPRLNTYRMALGFQLFGCLGGYGNTGFSHQSLGGYTNLHGALL